MQTRLQSWLRAPIELPGVTTSSCWHPVRNKQASKTKELVVNKVFFIELGFAINNWVSEFADEAKEGFTMFIVIVVL